MVGIQYLYQSLEESQKLFLKMKIVIWKKIFSKIWVFTAILYV